MSDVLSPAPHSDPDEPTGGTTPTGGEPAADATGAPPGEPKGMSRQAKAVVAVLVVAALVALFWPRGDGTFEAPGGFLTDAAGRPQTLGARMAPVSLVHFWATWCPPCMTEIPTLDRMNEELSQYRDFRLLMIAVDDEIPKVETFLGSAAGGVLYDHNWDVAHRYGTRKLPETYLVVRGRVVEKWEGAQDWDDPALRQRVRDALEGIGARPEVAGDTPDAGAEDQPGG